MDEAGKIKHRLEQKQREVKKQNDKDKTPWQPIYFELQMDEDTGEEVWIYNGDYLKDRAQKSWNRSPDIY